MREQFTPGPWEAQPYSEEESGLSIIAVRTDVPKGGTPTRGQVAYLHTLAGAHFEDPAVCIATARLIAASPQLLEVAQMVAEASELSGVNGPLAEAARAAIAAATGGAA